MIEFWATVGCACFDATFHQDIFTRTDPTASFQQLTQLRSFLASKALRLGRWEVMSLNRIFTQRWDGTRKIFFRTIAEDQSLNNIRAAAGATSMPLPDRTEICGVVGLACIDTAFRTSIRTASTIDPDDIGALDVLLRKLNGASPKFRLQDAELAIINRLIRGSSDQMTTHMQIFEQERWVQPLVMTMFGGCDAGHTEKRYEHISQQDLAIFLSNKPDLLQQLRAERAII
jgi:hypothetical protein